MTVNHRHADYDQISRTYDKRYERNKYAGVERALQEFIGHEPDAHILEVGCGTGHWLKALQTPQRHPIGLDYSTGMLSQAQKRDAAMPLIRGRAEHLPLSSESFDRLFCVNAIHHFVDKRAFLAEARRLLRPGGKILTVGLDPHRGLDQWHIYDYFPESLTIDEQRYPSSDELREWMGRAGFQDCVTHEVEHWTIRLPAREILEQGRLDYASTSQLSVLTEKEYQQGLERIREDIARADSEGRVLFLSVDLRLYGTSGSV
jgi:SAM-dependent methyltransferase